MKFKQSTAMVWAVVAAGSPLALGADIGTAFTYQGQLKQGGIPVNAHPVPDGTGGCDFSFSLWSDSVGGTSFGQAQNFIDQDVTNGLFTVKLNEFDEFGPSAFNGDARWLEIHVACPTGTFSVTLGRQELTPGPYALFAASGAGGGAAWSLTGNAGTNPATNFLGTTDNQALEVRVNNQRALRLEPNATSPNVIGGHEANTMGANVVGATIGGGGWVYSTGYRCNGGPNDGDGCITCSSGGFCSPTGLGQECDCDHPDDECFGTCQLSQAYCSPGTCSLLATGGNAVFDSYGTIGGGKENVAGSNDGLANASGATIGGGVGNVASVGSATVGGGNNNNATGVYATVVGGSSNNASAIGATVGGGISNTASGLLSTVPGGGSNQAGGSLSFAAGSRSKVRTAAQVGGGDTDGDQGTFVWADSTNADFTSTGPNQFLIRASGGVGIGTSTPRTPLHLRGETWTTLKVEAMTNDPVLQLTSDASGIDNDWTARMDVSDGNKFQLRYDNSSKLVVQTNGNVGIGTSSPDATLDVAGTIVSTAAGDATLFYAKTNASGTPTDDGVRMRWENNFMGTGDTLIFEKTDGFTTNPDGGIAFVNTGNDGIVDLLLHLDGSGNVGIGTSAPSTDLHVESASTNITGFNLKNSMSHEVAEPLNPSQRFLFQVNGSIPGGTNRQGNLEIWGSGPRGNNNVFTASPTGNVGIGTTNPAAKLHIARGSTGVGVFAGDRTAFGNALFETDSSVPATHAWFAENGIGVFAVTAGGRTITSVLEITGGSDLSEQFDVTATEGKAEPGMVVCIDAANPGKLALCGKAYDRTVAGVISGAGDVKPGMVMGQKGTSADGEYPVALTGRVYVQVDASFGEIVPGDLLTTSDSPGHAMKISDFAKAQGAIIGKAMTGLESGSSGLVLVLVSLQ